MRLSGAQILLECLKREGVELIFGYPGGVILDIYDLLPETGIRHVLVRHEQAAVHAADGYARACGRVGVALVTSGPGATNTVTAIATAAADSIPVVIFTGQVSTGLIGNDAFQEVDIVGITRPCTKHNYLVREVEELAHVVRQAFHLARSGRPGPILVDLPRNVLTETAEFVYPEQVRMRSYNPNYKPNHQQLKKAAEALLAARRPLFLVGGGAVMSGAGDLVSEIAHKLYIPVTSTLMGLGAFPGDDKLHLGMLGMHGLYAANRAVSHCDTLVSVGVRFDDRVTGRVSAFAPEARIIHIDIDPASIRKNVQVSIPLVADCSLALEGLRQMLEPHYAETDWSEKHAEWLNTLAQWQADHPMTYAPDQTLKPQEVIEAVAGITKGDVILTTDVGQHQMWTAQFFKFNRPRSLITSGGLGTMGFGLPAAIGAQLAFPNKLVACISGDGSIQMNIQELATAVTHNLPVKVIIFNNGRLGMIRQLQEFFYGGRYMANDLEVLPDFVKLAEAYGAKGWRISRRDELLPVLSEALSADGPAFIDVLVEPLENVYPMVPAGGGLNDMLLA